VNTIYPVIAAVPESLREQTGRTRTRALSRYARKALALSAEASGVSLPDLPKAENGAPRPVDGYHWSITHTLCYVAGVVAPGPVGIDIETIRPRSSALLRRIADAEEWNLAGSKDRWRCFFRFWTAKESVLKAVGIGLSDLSRCRIQKIQSDHRLMIRYQEHNWNIEHLYGDDCVASLTCGDWRVKWRWANLLPEPHGAATGDTSGRRDQS